MTTARTGRLDSTKSSTCLQLQYNSNAEFTGKEAIPFTVKGPIPVHLPESNGDYMGRTGCSMLELSFQYPCQIGELVFTNYYTAWMSVFVKRMTSNSSKAKTTPLKDKEISPPTHYRSRPMLERSFSIDIPGSRDLDRPRSPLPKLPLPLAAYKDNQILRLPSTTISSSNPALAATGPMTTNMTMPTSTDELVVDSLDIKMEASATGCLQQLSFSKRRNSSGSLSTETVVTTENTPWELSIETKNLMPWPHFEYGSQDLVSIPATESMVEWRDVVVMRLVLHQPSTVWKRYTIEELNVFRHLPKRGFSHCDDIIRQRDNWFSMLKMNTKVVLTGQHVEPENNTVSDDGMTT